MKTTFRIMGLLACLAALIVSAICGEVSATSLAIAPLATQKAVFLNSLKEEYGAIDTWLNQATDLSAFVSEGQTIKFPEGGAKPAVYVDRITDVDSVEPSETALSVDLKVYDTQNYKLRNIFLHALPYDKVKFYTQKSAYALREKEVLDAAYALCPTSAGNKKIFVPTTGAAAAGAKKPLTLADIQTLARACDNAKFPRSGRNLVLPSDLWWDLANNEVLIAQLKNQQNTGVLNPQVLEYYGFTIHKSEMDLGIACNLTTPATPVKAAQGAAISGSIVPCGFLFLTDYSFYAGGTMQMFNKTLSENTAGRAYEFGFQHRFLSGFQMSGERYSAMIYQAIA